MAWHESTGNIEQTMFNDHVQNSYGLVGTIKAIWQVFITGRFDGNISKSVNSNID
jgi:hypothetical protein